MKRILIVDDHEIVRDGLNKILNEQPDSITFGEAGTASEALQLVSEQDWDIVVLDLSLGGRSGLELLKELKQLRPGVPVLILKHAFGRTIRAPIVQSRGGRLHNQRLPAPKLNRLLLYPTIQVCSTNTEY